MLTTWSTEYGSTEDTYTAYPMLGCSYNFEGFEMLTGIKPKPTEPPAEAG